ncbi:expressed protein [Echinococcus multilocularis]|uniref:Expressed protein n=1 Tax=Echinococcus multilocularis TaxID=6211 RepID=A0A068YN56_ECHMU|nr:expressed protein [Echinococcus multilocularis]
MEVSYELVHGSQLGPFLKLQSFWKPILFVAYDALTSRFTGTSLFRLYATHCSLNMHSTAYKKIRRKQILPAQVFFPHFLHVAT